MSWIIKRVADNQLIFSGLAFICIPKNNDLFPNESNECYAQQIQQNRKSESHEKITHQIKQSYFVIYLPTHSNFKAKKWIEYNYTS